MKAAKEYIVRISSTDGVFESYVTSSLDHLDGSPVPRSKADRYYTREEAERFGSVTAGIVCSILGIPLFVDVEEA